MKPLILLSGGLDSAVCLWMMKNRNPGVLTFKYGQPHEQAECDAAVELAVAAGCDMQKCMTVNLEDAFLPQKLLGAGFFSVDDAEASDTVVPGRNLIFLSVAASIAAVRGFDSVVIGCNASDLLDYPDCRLPFLHSTETAIHRGVGRIAVHAPLSNHTKGEVVAKARELGVPIDLTMSCYRGMNCGDCAACKLREEALR